MSAFVQSATNTIRAWIIRRSVRGKDISHDLIMAHIRELWPNISDKDAGEIALRGYAIGKLPKEPMMSNFRPRMRKIKIADPEFCRKLYALLGLDLDGLRAVARVRITVAPNEIIEVEETSNIHDGWHQTQNAAEVSPGGAQSL